MSQAIIKKDIQKRLSESQQILFREFRKECNIQMLSYQIERYSDSNHKRHLYFKQKTNDWSSPYWGKGCEEIILCLNSTNGIGCIEELSCPCLGLIKDITEYSSW